MSVDLDELSNATHKMNMHSVTLGEIMQGLENIPDFVWASPDCTTYSRLSGGIHRKVNGQWERTDRARRHNFDLLKILEIMLAIQKSNRNAIFVIENPDGAMDPCPLMKLAKRMLGLRTVRVHYCAFGRDERKATHLWTNDEGLASRLSLYTCENMCTLDQHKSIRRGKGELVEVGRSQLAHCVIPETLACVVARYVDARLEQSGRRL
jgi:hypothetical protein